MVTDSRVASLMATAVAAAIAVGGGLASDLFAARGPITPSQGLGVMIIALRSAPPRAQ